MTRRNAHRRERHRLLARAAEAVQRHAGHRDRPTRVEHRHAPDVVGVISRVRAVAAHHVVDVARIEARLLLQREEHLREHALRVEVRERALPRLAGSARRTNGVDDPGFASHGRFLRVGWI
jgi:hypothetical protein